MPCNCGGSASPQVNFKVTFKDGSTQVFTTSEQAQQAIRSARGGMMRAVPAGSS